MHSPDFGDVSREGRQHRREQRHVCGMVEWVSTSARQHVKPRINATADTAAARRQPSHSKGGSARGKKRRTYTRRRRSQRGWRTR